MFDFFIVFIYFIYFTFRDFLGLGPSAAADQEVSAKWALNVLSECDFFPPSDSQLIF